MSNPVISLFLSLGRCIWPGLSMLLRTSCLLLLASAANAAVHVQVSAYQPAESSISGQVLAWHEEEEMPNPCFGWGQCYVGPDIFYKEGSPGMAWSCQSANLCIRAEQLRTTAEVMRAYQAAFGTGNSFSLRPNGGTAQCVGMAYTESLSSSYGAGRLFPGATCGGVPMPNQACDIELPSEIAFGLIVSSEVDGATRSIIGDVRCNLSGSVILTGMSGTGERNVYLDSERTIYSTLEIDGQDAAGGVKVPVQGLSNTQFTLASRLHTLGLPKAGNYAAHAIVYISYE